jgi:hypothetical protein
MNLFKRVPFMDELLIKSRVLIKPYFIGHKVKVELNNLYILELSYSEAIEAQKQLSVAIHKLEQKDKAPVKASNFERKVTKGINAVETNEDAPYVVIYSESGLTPEGEQSIREASEQARSILPVQATS